MVQIPVNLKADAVKRLSGSHLINMIIRISRSRLFALPVFFLFFLRGYGPAALRLRRKAAGLF